MRGTANEVLAWGAERAQTGPWTGRPWSEQRRIAHLTPLGPARGPMSGGRLGLGASGPTVPSSAFLHRCLATLESRGYTGVVTSALTAAEARAFCDVGFEEHERLLLLTHDLRRLQARSSVPLHAAGRRHRQQVLALDAAAFNWSWRLDEGGLEDALAATPASRLRVALTESPAGRSRVSGYAVCGRAGSHGYLQRLAVHPQHRRAGLGTALVLDGLWWMRRHRVSRAMVNTQPDNESALALYLHLGFRLEPSDLRVLRFDLRR